MTKLLLLFSMGRATKSSSWLRAERVPVWPRPRTVSSSGSSAAVVRPQADLLVHAEGCCGTLLADALVRYLQLIFWVPSSGRRPLPYLRVRAPGGLRDDARPPELCDADESPETFRQLRIVVQNSTETPLQLGVDESYSLQLDASGGTLTAASEWGALRGLETFAQLVQWDGDRYVLCGLPLTLADAPQYAWRGLLLDTARHFLPVETLLSMLDGMAALKLNTLHWHLTDSHAFPLRLDAAPRLADGALHPTLVYTPADLRAVVEAARLRGIRVVPELDMPAHTASWGLARPELVVACPRRVADDAEGLEHGVNKIALNPLREEVYELIGALLAELATIFPDEYLHLGGDEVDAECWLAAPEVLQWARAHGGGGGYGGGGAAWKARLQAHFTRRVLEVAAPLRRRVLLWDEALEMGDELPSGVAAIDVWRDWLRNDWQGELREQALATGRQVVHSALDWYLDLPGNTWEVMYGLKLPRAATAPAALLGGEASSWHEHADATNLQQRVLTRAAAVAERLWSDKASSVDIARQRLASFRCRLLRRGLQAAPVIPDACDVPAASSAAAAAHLSVDAPQIVAAQPLLAPLPCVPPIPRTAAGPERPSPGLLVGSQGALVACLLASLALNLLLGAAWIGRRAARPNGSAARARAKVD